MRKRDRSKAISRRGWPWLLAGLFSLLGGLGLSPDARAQGIIEGKVINGTFPDRPVSVSEVILYRQQENQPPEEVAKQPTPEGRYRFEGIPIGPQVRYHLAANYQGILQYGDEIAFEGGHPASELIPPSPSPGAPPSTGPAGGKEGAPGRPSVKTADMKVYELTTETKQISVSRAHIILDIVGQELTVTEFVLLENPGNRTVWGRQLLRFSLPAGAQGFQGPGEATREMGGKAGGFWLTAPIPPGQKQLLYGYSLPFSGKEQEFRRHIDLPIAQLDVLIADKGLEVSSPSLTFRGPVEMGDNQKFLRWSAAGLQPGTLVGLQLQPPRSIGRLFTGGAVALVLLLVVGGFAYPFVRSRMAGPSRSLSSPAPAKKIARDGPAALKRERRRLLEAVADLDDRYEAGEMAEAEYRRVREPQFEQLVEMTARLREDAQGRAGKGRG